MSLHNLDEAEHHPHLTWAMRPGALSRSYPESGEWNQMRSQAVALGAVECLDHNWKHYTIHTSLIIIRLSGNGTKTHDMRIFSCSVKTLLILSPHLRCRIESLYYVGNISCRNNVICNLKYHHILLFQSLLCSQFWPRFIQNNGIWIN